MSKKTLNQANLEKLGADRLAALVMELVQGSAPLQRRARMELSAAQGPREVIADLRKRFASLRRSTGHVGWRRQKALVKDLRGLVAMIETAVAPHDPAEAFELLWSFLQLAPSIYARTDDSNGSVGEVMREAMAQIADLSPRLALDHASLAERILEAVVEAGDGEFDGIVPATAEVLGEEGLEHLKRITRAWRALPPGEDEMARYRTFGLSAAPEDSVRRDKHLTASVLLADIADAQGDVDGYMARYSARQLTYGTIAPGVARRLLDAGRVDEAAAIIAGALAADGDRPSWRPGTGLDEIHEECLERQGKTAELKAHLLARFEQGLSARALRRYLKMLPDFEDIEAEDRALGLVEQYPDAVAALAFLIAWPALGRAAQLVVSRPDALDANAYEVLTPAADALEADHPLAATLLRRAMIRDTLDGAKSRRYRHAARHLAECEAVEALIVGSGGVQTYRQFIEALRQAHGRKHGFWHLVDP